MTKYNILTMSFNDMIILCEESFVRSTKNTIKPIVSHILLKTRLFSMKPKVAPITKKYVISTIRITSDNSNKYVGRIIEYTSRNMKKYAIINSASKSGKTIHIKEIILHYDMTYTEIFTSDLGCNLETIKRKILLITTC